MSPDSPSTGWSHLRQFEPRGHYTAFLHAAAPLVPGAFDLRPISAHPRGRCLGHNASSARAQTTCISPSSRSPSLRQKACERFASWRSRVPANRLASLRRELGRIPRKHFARGNFPIIDMKTNQFPQFLKTLGAMALLSIVLAGESLRRRAVGRFTAAGDRWSRSVARRGESMRSAAGWIGIGSFDVTKRKVEAWPDGSGQGHHARQQNFEFRPVLQTSAGGSTVRFDGRNSFLASEWNAKFEAASVFIVAAPRLNGGGFRGLATMHPPGRNDYRAA